MDDIGKSLPGYAPNRSRTDLFGELTKAVSCRDDVRHDIFAIHHDRSSGDIPERRMQRRPVVGIVDELPGKHLLTPALDAGAFCQPEQQRTSFPVDVGF